MARRRCDTHPPVAYLLPGALSEGPHDAGRRALELVAVAQPVPHEPLRPQVLSPVFEEEVGVPRGHETTGLVDVVSHVVVPPPMQVGVVDRQALAPLPDLRQPFSGGGVDGGGARDVLTVPRAKPARPRSQAAGPRCEATLSRGRVSGAVRRPPGADVVRRRGAGRAADAVVRPVGNGQERPLAPPGRAEHVRVAGEVLVHEVPVVADAGIEDLAGDRVARVDPGRVVAARGVAPRGDVAAQPPGLGHLAAVEVS